MQVYLDLNIFDRIEKLNELDCSDRQLYSELKDLILNNKFDVPYSNAHLNDLFRGYQKNPDYIDGHLRNIEELTKNLCICQYWGKDKAIWHYREIREFFEEKKEEWKYNPSSFSELLEIGEDEGIPNPMKIMILLPLPAEWKQIYSHDPIFGIMYPKSRIENNYLALMEDIFNFQEKLKSDYSLYKTFKSYLIRSINKLNSNKEMLKTVKENFKDLPKHLDVFDLSMLYPNETKTSDNQLYSKLIDVFYKFDLKGYKTDANFNNMFDDSLHTFYAAHCSFFITNDDRCKYKAEKTYERLKIKTIVIKANEIDKIKNSL